jgi:hypothetical protein
MSFIARMGRADQPSRLAQPGQAAPGWTTDRRVGSRERHEAMRDLVRAREAAHIDYTRNRQQVSSFLLRLGRIIQTRRREARHI